MANIGSADSAAFPHPQESEPTAEDKARITELKNQRI